jgi:hypothetical protein
MCSTRRSTWYGPWVLLAVRPSGPMPAPSAAAHWKRVRGPQMSRDWDPDRRAAAFEKLHNRSRPFALPTASLRIARRAVLIERGGERAMPLLS